MQIRILRLGHSAQQVEAPAGATLGEALSQAEVPTQGYTLAVNGLGVSDTATLQEGDVVTLVPKVEGGAR